MPMASGFVSIFKIENPLFSNTWWVRLCNFAFTRDSPNTNGAHLRRRVTIVAHFDRRVGTETVIAALAAMLTQIQQA